METRVLPIDPPSEPDDLEAGLSRLRRMVETSDVPAARIYMMELVARWPADPRVQHWDRVLKPPRVTVGVSRVQRSITPDLDWLRDHAHEYPGRWLAVYGGRLVACEPDAQRFRHMLSQHPEWDHPVIRFQPGRSE